MALHDLNDVSRRIFRANEDFPNSNANNLSMNGIPSFLRVNRTTQLGVVSKFAEGALDSVVDVIDKDVKEHRSQDRPLGDATRYRPPPEHRTIDHHPLNGIPSSVSTAPLSLVSSANLLRVYSIPSSMSLIKMLKSTSPKTDPWGTPLVTGLHLDIEPFRGTLTGLKGGPGGT